MSGHPVTPSFNGVYPVQPQWPPNSASVLPSGMPYPLIPQSTLASPFFPVNNVHSMGIAPFVNHLPQPFRDATYQESPTKNLHSASSTLVPSPQQQKSVGALQVQERNLGRESSKSMASNDREEGEWSSNEEAHPPARDAVASQSWPVNKFHPKPNGKPGQDTRLGDSDSRLGPTPSNKEIPNGTRTTTSLRTQAQGALLSLHPHKISYPELVKEGIDSSILRSLYEEVGIKVVDPVLNPVAAVDLEEKRREESSSNNISSQATAALVPQLSQSQSPKPDFSRQEPRQPELSRPEPSQSEPVPDNTSEFQRTNQLPPESTRTLSRRELIAQKFAAQREKATTAKEVDQDKEAATTTAATMEKPLDRNITSNDGSNLPSVDPAEKSSIESKAKKSKAQTELAKQRIEQLKMQGIQTRQSRSKPETSAPVFQPSFNTSQSQGVVPAPGLSGPPGNLTTGIPGMSGNSRIPGLFLTTSETMQPQDLKSIDQQISSPQLTNKSRPPKKRPRATDFNEADFEGGQKRQNTLDLRSGYSDRVVIDLSEDEFIYGTDGEERNSLVAEEMPNTNNQTHQTPEKSKDAKDGWMNNVPLNELRKLIAEKERLREQKRLASNRCETSTNHSANNNGNDVLSRSQSVEMSNVGEVHDAPCTVHSPHQASHNPNTASSSLPPKPVEINERSQLEEMEVNISMIDAEIAKHEGELAHIQAEEQRLLSEIAKEKNNKNELVKKLEKIRIPPETPRTEETVEPHRQGSPKHVQSEKSIEPGIEAVQSTDKQESSLPQTASAITSVEANNTDENPVPTSSLEYQSSGTSSVVHVSTEAEESQNDARIEDTSHSEQVPELSVVQTRGSIPEVFDEHRSEVKQDNFDNQNNLTASRAASLVSDGYEPPESLPAPSEPEYSPPFSPVAPEATESKDMEPTTDSANKNPEALILNSQVPEKQPEPETSQDATAGEWHHFSPYESPLRLFKAYRYHPQFTRTVSGGYRSLTYSHNIDPQKELCAREAVGEDCDDPTCPYQHFRDMYLSDDKILLDISSKREGRTPEEKAQYVEGLKQLVTDMRQRNVNDFNTLATEIAEYHRPDLQQVSPGEPSVQTRMPKSSDEN